MLGSQLWASDVGSTCYDSMVFVTKLLGGFSAFVFPTKFVNGSMMLLSQVVVAGSWP
jgi:hypothetical protein